MVALLVLGPKRLPEVGRALGRTMRDFRSAISGEDTHEPEITETVATTPVVTNPAPAENATEHTAAASPEPQAAGPGDAPTTSERQPTAAN